MANLVANKDTDAGVRLMSNPILLVTLIYWRVQYEKNSMAYCARCEHCKKRGSIDGTPILVLLPI